MQIKDTPFHHWIHEVDNDIPVGVVSHDGVMGWLCESPHFPKSIHFPDKTLHDAMFFTTAMLQGMGFKLTKPTASYNWCVYVTSEGFFAAMPGDETLHDNVLRKEMFLEEAGAIARRLNNVRSYFGTRVREATMEQMFQLEARMLETEKRINESHG